MEIKESTLKKLNKMGFTPEEAIQNFIWWEKMRAEVMAAIVNEIKRLGNVIEELTNEIKELKASINQTEPSQTRKQDGATTTKSIKI